MKNKILKASLLFLGSLSLVACGGNPGSSEGGDGGKTEPSNVSKDKTISFWHCIGHDKMRNLNRIITAFNKAHKDTDGYQIVPEKLSGSYDDLHDAVKTKLQAGYVPSITMGYPDSFSEYMGTGGVEKSKILNLDSFINNDADFHPETFVDMYYQEGKGYQYEGTWSVPLYKSTEAMYINKEMFQSTTFYKEHKNDTHGSYGAVIGDPSTWDWDTLTYVASQVQAEKGTAPGSDFHALGYDSDANLFISQMAQRNIPYTSATGTGEEHFKFVDTKGTPNADLVAFGAELMDLINSGALATQGSTGSYSSDLFLKKKAMITIGSTGGSAYNDPKGSTTSDFTCSLYAVPAYQGKNNAKYIMQGPSLCFFDTKDPAKEAAAWEFYSKFVSDPELNAALALENSYDPVRKASYETDNYKNWTAQGKTEDGKDDEEKELAYRIPALTATIKDNYITSPVFVGSSKARTEIGKVLSYAQSFKGSSSDKVSSALVKAWTECINYIRSAK